MPPMKIKGLTRRKWNFRPRVRGLCQTCLVPGQDVFSPRQTTNKEKEKGFLGSEEINHKEIRQSALLLMEKGMITKEEYIMVLDADLKYEAGLDQVNLQLEASLAPRVSPSPPPSPSPSPSPSHLFPVPSTHALLPDDRVDPITFEELGDNIFSFVTPHGNVIKYNVSSLVEYISATGDFRDPVTRCSLSQDDMRCIDALLLNDKSCSNLSNLQSVRENSHYYCIQKQKKEECQNLEACLGEIVVEMLDIIETSVVTWGNNQREKAEELAEMKLFLLFSEFESPFSLLKELNIEQARHSLLSWIIFLKGPVKRPTKVKGPSGCLQRAADFLQELWTSEDDIKLHDFQENLRSTTVPSATSNGVTTDISDE